MMIRRTIIDPNPTCVKDELVQAFSADRAHKPLAIRVLPRRLCSTNDFLDAHVSDALLKRVAVDAIAVANQEPWHCIVGECLDDLLSRPLGCRMSRYVEMYDASAIVAHDDEGKEYAERSRRHGEEVEGNDVSQVMVQACAPGLRRRLSSSNPVLPDGCFGHHVTEQREFGLDTRDAPSWILARDAADQPAILGLGTGLADLARSRLPAPEELETQEIPADRGVGLYD